MFWALQVEPKKLYSEIVSVPFRISKAVLVTASVSGDPDVQVIVTNNNNDFIICILKISRIVQETLDLVFSKGDEITIRSEGGGTVHLTGYSVVEQEIPNLLDGDDDGDASDDEKEDDSDVEDAEPTPKRPKFNGMRNGTSKKFEIKHDKPNQRKQQQSTETTVKTLNGGVKIQDFLVGQGDSAKSGKKVQVYFEGRIGSTNKVFKKTCRGKEFEFVLGHSKMAEGFDVGVQGMKVGGKRKIVCPPNVAYGPKGSKRLGIPPNATLVYIVELRNAK